MAGIREAQKRRDSSLSLLLVASLGVIVLAASLHFSGSAAFRPYFGDLNPILVATATTLLGVVGLVLLEKDGWFRVRGSKDSHSGLGLAAGLATLLAIPAVVLDLVVVFPADTNVVWPQAFLFYPAIGYVVEVAFHVLPLAVILLLLGRLAGGKHRQTLMWICIVLVSLLEPAVQTLLGPSDGFPRLATAYVALHVFVFNVCQLWVFKRHDFVSMLALRLVYYAWWHVLWGYARLQLLF